MKKTLLLIIPTSFLSSLVNRFTIPESLNSNDLVLFNYPYNYSIGTENNYDLFKSNRGIISFGKCFVVEVNTPIFLLWQKKNIPLVLVKLEIKKEIIKNI